MTRDLRSITNVSGGAPPSVSIQTRSRSQSTAALTFLAVRFLATEAYQRESAWHPCSSEGGTGFQNTELLLYPCGAYAWSEQCPSA
jgi:hypothetical protein